ncbi:hypothetical protein P389DRAFT_193761 [Cystobasidium minutum MCA 4210]|uniref:uncharacterized protein n=1 Tax=Cystobasidium minutum MCA 4210 TaxID=1397322 RepID=UPI0034CE5B2C|eukprot:jgi/Rhomi1/193761/gm1.1975_g
MSDNSQQPGLVTGHAKLAGGAVEAALGNLTGNTNLQSAGEQTKQAGIDELKSYQEQNPPSGANQDTTTGKIEQKIGSAVGCEGMVNDAQGSTNSSTGAASGTTGAAGTINPGDNVTPAHLGGSSQPGFGTGGASAGTGSRGDL